MYGCNRRKTPIGSLKRASNSGGVPRAALLFGRVPLPVVGVAYRYRMIKVLLQALVLVLVPTVWRASRWDLGSRFGWVSAIGCGRGWLQGVRRGCRSSWTSGRDGGADGL